MPNGEYNTKFMIMHSPQERGSLGLLQAVNEALRVCEVDEKKLMGYNHSWRSCKYLVQFRTLEAS